jgi:hypothetical protein
MTPKRLLLSAFALALAVGLVGGAFGGDFVGTPRLSPLYPPPPYLIGDTEHLLIFFEADPASIRELLPPGLEPAPSNTAFLNMYRANTVSGLGPYTATYITVDVQGFDSADGTKGRFMVRGWYGTEPVAAAFREVLGFPVTIGTTTVERKDNVVSAVLKSNGVPVIEARIAVTGKTGKIGGVLNYPTWRQIPTADGRHILFSELLVHRIPFRGDLTPADPVAVNFKVPDTDPLMKLQPRQLLGAAYFRGDSIALGTTDLISRSNGQ